MSINLEEFKNDFLEAMYLLSKSRPHNLLISDDEYFERLHKLQDKYFEDEDEEV